MIQKKYILPLLLFIQIIVLKIVSFFPEFIEKYYSNGLYPIISKISRTTFGFTSVSIGDLIYGIILFLVFRWFWNVRKTWKINWKDNLLKVLGFASVFYFLFHFLWATNYHRVKLFEKMDIDKEYSVYQEALDKDYFCKRADGPYMKGKVWPGECNFPDFTNPEVREWWAGLYKELISEIGVKGVWNDMNEPAVMDVPGKTFPMDVRHDYDGHPCSHRKAHNIYGTQMARATYDGVKRFAYPKRPFIITRSAYSGAQRYTSSWTGDNVASWEHLWIANIQMQRMSISGMGFTGSDIGGFAEQPSGELYARWIQLGVFHPFCRTHSSGDHGEQEPWSFGKEVIDITRKFVNLRYQLLPYLYTMFWKYVNEGEPMLKPLVYFDQEDIQTHYRTDEFIFGNQILVCPILEPNAIGRRMYLPKGNWYNYWTNELEEGKKEFWVATAYDQIPLFIKEGAIIPKYPVQQYVGEKEFEEITLDVYYKPGKEKSVVYEDAQDGYDYNKGRFSLCTFNLTGKEKELIIQLHKEGEFITNYSKFRINFIGLPFKISSIEIDNEAVYLDTVAFDGKNTIVIDKFFSELHIFGE